jgi:glycosyltransferase involved in cell wall biosynthesis
MPALVSILIPAYNSEKWIAETIKSALNQTWPNKELIIVDDGSIDNTLQVAKEFESKLVKIISQENKGAAAARNTALRFAQGDYIQWLDADDLLSPDKISLQLKYSDCCRNGLTLFSSSYGTFYYRVSKTEFIPTALWQDLFPVEWLLRRFSEKIWMINSSWLMSRRLLELVGPWDERLSMDDDGEYFCRSVAKSEKIKFVPESKSYYRNTSMGSLSQNKSSKALESQILSTILSISHLMALEDSERTRSACLKFLQRRLHYIYPENYAMLEKVTKVAQELGGVLSPPDESLSFFFIRQLFGWKIAKRVKSIASNTEISVFKNWDRLLYLLTGK